MDGAPPPRPTPEDSGEGGEGYFEGFLQGPVDFKGVFGARGSG